MGFLDIFQALAPVAQIAAPVASYVLQKDAIGDATQAQTDAADKSLTLSERIYNQNRQDMQPFMQTGVSANNRLNELMGLVDFDREAIGRDVRQKYAALFPQEVEAEEQSKQQVYPYPSTNGWNEAEQVYTDPFGRTVDGERGKRMSEAAWMQSRAEQLTRDAYGDNGLSSRGGKAWRTNVAMPMGGINARGDVYENPYNGLTYERSKAIEALQSGDLSGFAKQGAIASYNPTPGLLDKIGPYIAGAVLAAPAGLAAAGYGGAAMPASHAVGQAVNLGARGFSTVGNQLSSRIART